MARTTKKIVYTEPAGYFSKEAQKIMEKGTAKKSTAKKSTAKKSK